MADTAASDEMDAPDDASGTTADNALDVLIIGAGFSGICAGIKLRERGWTRFRIVDKADGIGGTWWENIYPGAACDVPSHFYCFSFEPNPNWSRLYSPQSEIQQYAEHCVDKYGLRPHLHLGREVQSMVYQQADGLWLTTFTDGETLWSRFIISGAGGLHIPQWPDIPGRADFTGKAMHTATWDPDFDPAGKRIAVVGSAASAIQAVPQLARSAAHVTVFQRTANYIAARKDKAYTLRQQRRFARHRWWARLYRWSIFMWLERVVYPIIWNDRHRRKQAAGVIKHLHSAVPDPDLQRALTPDFELGCKRILISDDFFPALARDNVTLVTAGIDRITTDGVVDRTGALHAVDAIVFATGFDIEGQFRALDVIGPEGRSLRQLWKDRVEAYRGVMVAGFPNYFMTTGPNTGVGTTSVIFMIEQTVGWIVNCIDRLAPGETVAPKPEAQRAFNEEIQTLLAGSVWATGCQSWYKRDDGRIETLIPYNARRFRKEMRRLRLEELDIRQTT